MSLVLLLLLALCYALTVALSTSPVAGRPVRPTVVESADSTLPTSSPSSPPLPSQSSGGGSKLRSSSRGYMAVLYSGTVRTFSVAFQSHLVNLFAASPYSIHIFAHYGSGRGDWKSPAVEHERVAVYRGFNATLRYYEGYNNIDNQYVSLLDDCLKFNRMDDAVDMASSERFNYTEVLRLVGERFDVNSLPLSVVRALDSQRQVNAARVEYERTNGIKYAWVVRLRMDHVMKSNVWEDVFDIQPVVQPAAVTDPPFLPASTHPSMDPYLDLSGHSHPPSVHSATYSSLGLSARGMAACCTT